MTKPSVLFVCIHNAGRSQMAAGYLTHLSGGAVEVRSAGSAPATMINAVAVQAMAEEGIDITAAHPKVLTDEAVEASDVVITMGCGDSCPYRPGKRYEDWVLDDPAGQGIEAVRPIRDDIKRRVLRLLDELDIMPVHRPSVLFVCVKNGGKSQIAASLMRHLVGDSIEVLSAGTRPGTELNGEAVESLVETGASVEGEHPKPIDPVLLDTVDRVILLGPDATLDHPGRATVERWLTDEPSTRGITGMERMRLVRDDIDRRVKLLVGELIGAGHVG